MPIGTVCELTGLSERQIRYYEERKLIFPQRTDKGNRKYSFSDVESLMEIANKMEDGIQTAEIRKELLKRKEKNSEESLRNTMIKGQLNAQFHKGSIR
ncbi:MerR family transcriptional regulator [Pullulanibacillus camelliae]|nr:MerR family transcriptional regulator [Pullulanibacillus camelliae]